MTPMFLAVVLQDKAMPSKERMLSDLVLRCLGPKKMTSVLSEFNRRKLEVFNLFKTCLESILSGVMD